MHTHPADPDDESHARRETNTGDRTHQAANSRKWHKFFKGAHRIIRHVSRRRVNARQGSPEADVGEGSNEQPPLNTTKPDRVVLPPLLLADEVLTPSIPGNRVTFSDGDSNSAIIPSLNFSNRPDASWSTWRSPALTYGTSATMPPSPTLSTRSSFYFPTSLALRQNKPDELHGLSSLNLLSPSSLRSQSQETLPFFENDEGPERWVFENIIAVLMDISWHNQEYRSFLETTASQIKNMDPISTLINAPKLRVQLLQIASRLQISSDPSIYEALRKDNVEICSVIRRIMASPLHKAAMLTLKGDRAQSLLNLLQTMLDKGLFSSHEDERLSRDAHKLLVKLSMACDILPSRLCIKGVSLSEKEPIYGGGYADIYRAIYAGQSVALKRMRIFQRGNERHSIHRMIFREALLWQKIRHPYILPFVGVDPYTFPSLFCLVSPWMDHGTVLNHITENGGININRHLYEVAQGLEYLHSQNIIHGDLRGANILIDPNWHARIADFGLADLAEATLPSQTSRRAGSVRWMAPELHDPESFGLSRFQRTRASDVYSFACTCVELYTGQPPFSYVRNDSTVILMVIRGDRPDLFTSCTTLKMPDQLCHVVTTSWAHVSSERPYMAQVVRMMGTILP